MLGAMLPFILIFVESVHLFRFWCLVSLPVLVLMLLLLLHIQLSGAIFCIIIPFSCICERECDCVPLLRFRCAICVPCRTWYALLYSLCSSSTPFSLSHSHRIHVYAYNTNVYLVCNSLLSRFSCVSFEIGVSLHPFAIVRRIL